MKKTVKKIVALFLVCLMVFSVAPLSATSSSDKNISFVGPDGKTYNHYPQITVAGLGVGCVNIYYEDDPEQKSLFWPFETDRFINNLKNIDEYIVKSIKDKQYDVLYTIVYNYLMDCFGMLALNPDGSMMDGVTAEPMELRYQGDGKYELFFDFRQSPLPVADYLNECIIQLMEETGSEKVELIGSSYGANVVTAYMYSYPEELHRIDTLFLRVPSVGGVSFLGELISGDFNISAKGVRDFADRLCNNNIIPDFFYILEATGILEIFLSAMVTPVFREAVFDAVVDVARDAVATIPALWVCVPDEHFESAMINMYGENYKDPNHTYAALISEMTHYHYDIANKAVEIYKKAAEENEDLHIAVIAKFGTAAIPLGSGENVMDDGFVTLPVSSLGAVCANYGEKLPTDYQQAKYTEYDFMCPEWNIDASTGAFPFTTWYIKGLEHSTTSADYLNMVDEIIYKNLDVFSDPDRPQFLVVSEEDPEKLEPLIVENEKESFFDIIIEFIKKLLIIPRTIIEHLKGKIPELV